MGGTAAKTLLGLAAIALLALGLAACGGSGGSTGSTMTGEGSAATAAKGGSGSSQEQRPQGREGGGAKGNSGGSSSGEGSAAFRTPGGDNSIQNFGGEAGAGEREAAAASLTAYLDARAKGNWARSCAYLAAIARQPLEQLTQSSPTLKGKGCAAIVGALSAQVPASARANPLQHGVASLRVKGDRAFALFHGPKGVNYFVLMVKEGGNWKVGSLAPSEFP